MKKQMILFLAIASILVTACGNSVAEESSVTSSAESTPTETPAQKPTATETEAPTETPRKTPMPTETPKESPLESPEESSEELPEEDPIDTSGDIHPATGATRLALGETLTLARAEGAYTLTVDQIALTDERTPELPAARVLRVDYHYENLSIADDLLIGELSFVLVDEAGANQSYYVFDLSKESNPIADLTPVGESCAAALGFELGTASNTLQLIYIDAWDESGAQYIWDVTL